MTKPELDLAAQRREYTGGTLDEGTVAPDPRDQFARWYGDVAVTSELDANACVLATVDENGFPDARVVLLKGLDPEGFVFFTDYRSAKARDLGAHPVATLCFHWPALSRQVRVQGRVARIAAAESDAYFATRPRESQVGAWSSEQSTVLPDRGALEARVRAATERFAGREVPRPPHWGGFRLTPDLLEFWQGREGRLHDRIRYRRVDDTHWTLERLSP